MRIKKNEKINNITLVRIRDYFKDWRGVGISKKDIGNFFDLNSTNSDLLINELINRGFIEKNIDVKNKHKNEYQLTDKGQSLCAARSVPLLNKDKADKIYNEFILRVEEINNSDYYLYKVEKLLLFGSYLDPNKNDFGDIDIAFELKRKVDDFEKYEIISKNLIREMKQKGKKFSSPFEEMFYPEYEVMLKLKNRCQYISLHPIDNWILKKTKFKQIYPKVDKN